MTRTAIRAIRPFLILSLFFSGCATAPPGDTVRDSPWYRDWGTATEIRAELPELAPKVLDSTAADSGDPLAAPDRPESDSRVLAQGTSVHRAPVSSAPGAGNGLRRPFSPLRTSSPSSVPAENGAEPVVLNFNNADLTEVIRTFSELLGINYMLPPGIQGGVTIHTTGELDRGQLFSVFFQILEANGLTAVEEDGLYKIVPVGAAGRLSISARLGRRDGGLPPGQRMVMQIIPLEYISADEMTKILTPFVSAEGTILSHEGSNTLLLVDRIPAIEKALRLVEAFDVDLFSRMSYQFYSPRHISAEDLSGIMGTLIEAMGMEGGDRIQVVPIERLGKVLVLSPESEIFRRLDLFIEQIDVPSDGASPRIYVYSVRNSSAEELAELLNSVFTAGETSEEGGPTETSSGGDSTGPAVSASPGEPANPFERTASTGSAVRPPGGATMDGGDAFGTHTLRGGLKITPDPVRNLLIIEAIPSDYEIVADILRQIDILPRQVLIEVIIAEISLDGTEELGVEWSYRKGEGNLSTSLLEGTAGSGGLQFAVGQVDRWTSALSALASENKLNVLSRPTVLASDSKEARINVSTQIPVASAQYLYDSGPQGVTQTNIQYRDTGIILSVTPHISDTGLVSMEISQEVSESGDGVDVAGQSFPSFRERKVDTTLTVGDKQTIFIGGLMRERKTEGNSGVPFLSRLPLVGFLFGKDSAESEKSELILLITPHVITDSAMVDAVTKEFASRVNQISGNIQRDPGIFPQSP